MVYERSDAVSQEEPAKPAAWQRHHFRNAPDGVSEGIEKFLFFPKSGVA
jgi:hypothetical protein